MWSRLIYPEPHLKVFHFWNDDFKTPHSLMNFLFSPSCIQLLTRLYSVTALRLPIYCHLSFPFYPLASPLLYFPCGLPSFHSPSSWLLTENTLGTLAIFFFCHSADKTPTLDELSYELPQCRYVRRLTLHGKNITTEWNIFSLNL